MMDFIVDLSVAGNAYFPSSYLDGGMSPVMTALWSYVGTLVGSPHCLDLARLTETTEWPQEPPFR